MVNKIMHAEIISIGDEIVGGQSLDTNSQWLSQRLEEWGFRVLYHTTVGDELAPGRDVFRQAIARSDLVVATGGLGPTADDLTREVLAQAVDRPLQRDPEALEQIRAVFARRNRPMPPQNELQAMFPAGSHAIPNPHGTAPGIDLEVPRAGRNPCRVICLPGVPAEMVEMWRDSVVGILQRLNISHRIVRRRIHCFGAGESQIESMLPDLIRRGRRPTVGITASHATITLRIAAEGESESECRAAIEPVATTIRQCLGTLVFGEEDDELQHAVLRMLRERRQTLAVAEWGTAGLVSQWLAGLDDAGGYFRGGLIIPDEAVLRHLEWIEDAGPNASGAPPSEWVDAMALGCRRRFGADLGLAVGPFSAAKSDGGDTGSILLALAAAENIHRKKVPLWSHPAAMRSSCAKHALNFVRLELLGGP